ncbi:MAG: acyloxyacyl hydrolase [Gammaproteobacteria bacterium]|nr:acyloxyacyl hydrolase [Gammaproteobacteria bacterium]
MTWNKNSFLILLLIILSIFRSQVYGLNAWEANVSPIIKKSSNIDNSSQIYGGRLALAYNFFNYKSFGLFELLIDGSIAHIKTSERQDKPDFSKNITIFSPALIARWYPVNFTWKKTAVFLEAGVGPSYMTNDDFGGRKLGMRYSFQDIGSIGIKTWDDQLIIGAYMIHYSNAGFHKNNRGITLPPSLRVGYRF